MQRETKRQRLRRELAGERAGLPVNSQSKLRRTLPGHEPGSDHSHSMSDAANDDSNSQSDADMESSHDHQTALQGLKSTLHQNRYVMAVGM